jgi:hypothetical protein
MKRRLLSVILLSVIFSCNTNNETEARKSFFNQIAFDTLIINNLPLYDSLKNIVLLNIDTIFKFRLQRDTLFNPDKCQSYSFLNNRQVSEEFQLENMPESIYLSVKKIFDRLGDSKINGFTLYSDSTIEISAKDIYKPEINLDAGHNLIWKRTYNYDSSDLIRDTIIAPQWTYQIWAGEHKHY